MVTDVLLTGQGCGKSERGILETRTSGKADEPMEDITNVWILCLMLIPTAEGSLNDKVDGQMSASFCPWLPYACMVCP